ncbi:MAG: PadR family transcriptional regulator [Acidobacteriota bacterium]
MRLTPSHFHILLSVVHEPSHGYAIMQEVQERTDGRVKLGPGSLYWAIKRLVDADLLEETAAPSAGSAGPSRRYYALTVAGREVLRREVEILADIVRFAESQELIRRV